MKNKNDGLTSSDVSNNKAEEATRQGMFTKPVRNGKIEYIEREVDRFDFEGYEVVRRELFSKANCPTVTFKYGKVGFNVRTIRKLDECSHIHILINTAKRLMIAKPCEEDDKDSLQWSRVDKRSKVVPRMISGKIFTAQLFEDMKWSFDGTVKILGTLFTCKDEKIFVFDLTNAEVYLKIAEPIEDDPKRRKRVPYAPAHCKGHYGQSYEESKNPIVMTIEDAPEGFVKITLPQLPPKKPTSDKAENSSNSKVKGEKNGTE